MKKFFKKMKKSEKLGLGTCAFLIIGTLMFILGSYIADPNMFEWLGTPQAFVVYFLIAIAVLYIAWIFLKIKLGGGSDE